MTLFTFLLLRIVRDVIIDQVYDRVYQRFRVGFYQFFIIELAKVFRPERTLFQQLDIINSWNGFLFQLVGAQHRWLGNNSACFRAIGREHVSRVQHLHLEILKDGGIIFLELHTEGQWANVVYRPIECLVKCLDDVDDLNAEVESQVVIMVAVLKLKIFKGY